MKLVGNQGIIGICKGIDPEDPMNKVRKISIHASTYPIDTYQTNQGCISCLLIIYPMYRSKAVTETPENLLASSKVLKPAPTARKKAVRHIVADRTTNQKVKKASADDLKPTKKYITTEKTLTWKRMMGMSVMICARHQAAG